MFRWLNQSIESLNPNSVLPIDYIELKSLIADLKGFRLEEYATKHRDKLKLNSIYSELQVFNSSEFFRLHFKTYLRFYFSLKESLHEKIDANN